MDRRSFLKAFLATPLLPSFGRANGLNATDCTVYIIGENPQSFFPLFLEELTRIYPPRAKAFYSFDPHPQNKRLKEILLERGWKESTQSVRTGLSLFFRRLQNKAAPSFTFVRNGQVWDGRSGMFRPQWEEMNQNHSSSSCLTIASLNRPLHLTRNESVLICADGRTRGKYSIDEERQLSFSTRRGHITVQISRGEARVLNSSCRGKVCLCSPPISRGGERIICAPNHFFMEIQGASVDTVIG